MLLPSKCAQCNALLCLSPLVVHCLLQRMCLMLLLLLLLLVLLRLLLASPGKHAPYAHQHIANKMRIEARPQARSPQYNRAAQPVGGL